MTLAGLAHSAPRAGRLAGEHLRTASVVPQLIPELTLPVRDALVSFVPSGWPVRETTPRWHLTLQADSSKSAKVSRVPLVSATLLPRRAEVRRQVAAS